MGQRRHALDALLPLNLGRVFDLFLFLDRRHVHLAEVLGLVQVLVQGVWRMDRLVFRGGILACVLEDDARTSRVFCADQLRCPDYYVPPECLRTWQEFCYIIGLAVNNHPARVFGIVSCHLGAGEFGHGEWNGRGCNAKTICELIGGGSSRLMLFLGGLLVRIRSNSGETLVLSADLRRRNLGNLRVSRAPFTWSTNSYPIEPSAFQLGIGKSASQRLHVKIFFLYGEFVFVYLYTSNYGMPSNKLY